MFGLIDDLSQDVWQEKEPVPDPDVSPVDGYQDYLITNRIVDAANKCMVYSLVTNNAKATPFNRYKLIGTAMKKDQPVDPLAKLKHVYLKLSGSGGEGDDNQIEGILTDLDWIEKK